MKLPRDVDADRLIKALKLFDYSVTRQTGSHIRISTTLKGQHHLTIPNHSPIKIGTLSSILTQAAEHHKLSKEDFIKKLFDA